MNTTTIAVAVLGIFIGSYLGFTCVNIKKSKMKKNVLKEIEKQKDIIFNIPKMENGKLEQHKIDLKEYCGINNEKQTN